MVAIDLTAKGEKQGGFHWLLMENKGMIA